MKPVQDAAAVPIQEEKHFAVSVLPSEHAVAADSVLGAFFTTIDGLGMRAWLAHETLLHWFENEDIAFGEPQKVHMPSGSVSFLARYYKDAISLGKMDDRYSLETDHPHVTKVRRSLNDQVTGRWLDKKTGLSLDISSVWKCESTEGAAYLCDEDDHKYEHEDIFPLQESWFRNINVMVPARSEYLIKKEFGPTPVHD